jgi:hypothetical protein
MKEIRYGTITLTLSNDVELLECASQLDRVALSRIPRAPTGLREACYQAADSLEKVQGQFIQIKDISPEILRFEGQRIDKLEEVIRDLEVILSRAKRTNLIQKAGTYAKLCHLNEFIKAYAKHSALYDKIFSSFLTFFKKR